MIMLVPSALISLLFTYLQNGEWIYLSHSGKLFHMVSKQTTSKIPIDINLHRRPSWLPELQPSSSRHPEETAEQRKRFLLSPSIVFSLPVRQLICVSKRDKK